MNWREFLKPTKTKIILTVLVLLIWLLITYGISELQRSKITPLIPLNVVEREINYPNLILEVILGILFEALLYYPFTCALYFLYQNFKDR